MEFVVLERGVSIPDQSGSVAYLSRDRWNDFSFVTMFNLSLRDDQGDFHKIGQIKIGFKGQTTDRPTYTKISEPFSSLGAEFFSVGQGTDYYRKIAALPNGKGLQILSALRDIVVNHNIIDEIKEEAVFKTSFMRDVSLSLIKGQYTRVLNGKTELTDFKFKFARPEFGELDAIDLTFNVKAESTPSTNIHAVIGRNGIGKTTLLNGMIAAITNKHDPAKFFDILDWQESEISSDYFSSLISVSFSAFDPFSPPLEQPDSSKGICYFYIGLKDPKVQDRHRTIPELRVDCVRSLITCFRSPEKGARWRTSIAKLGSDENFSSMRLEQLEQLFRNVNDSFTDQNQLDPDVFLERYLQEATPLLTKMSSGHAIVLLTISRLVSAVEEKTLILLDEPESHLHPPLLSAFIRALADLLHDQNGVAIIATHSPVVLQEIPKSCVWKIYRTGKSIIAKHPQIETFGENVGLLTSEVFSLEVERSGFHTLLMKHVMAGETYDQVLETYKEQLGFEARSILSSQIANRDQEKQL